MNNRKKIPLEIPGITQSLYAGFWTRLGSLLLDFAFAIPVAILMMYINSMGKNMYFYTVIPNLVFIFWYNIYLPKKYGGTPGKLLVGIQILRMDCQLIGWKEAVLRHLVMLLLSVFSIVLTTACILQADAETFAALGWIKQSQYLTSFYPDLFIAQMWVSNIWIYSEFIVLLTNKRKRAIHDFMAGTVIVKAKFIPRIYEAMYSDETNIDTKTEEEA